MIKWSYKKKKKKGIWRIIHILLCSNSSLIMTPVKTSLKGALRNLFHRRQQLCLEQLLGSHLVPCSCPCHTRHPTDPFTRRWINRPKSLTKNLPTGPHFPAWHQNSSAQEQEWETRHRDSLRFSYPGRAPETTESGTSTEKPQNRSSTPWLLNTVPKTHCTEGIS